MVSNRAFGMLILYYIQHFAAVRHYIVFVTGVQLSATSFNFIKGLFEQYYMKPCALR